MAREALSDGASKRQRRVTPEGLYFPKIDPLSKNQYVVSNQIEIAHAFIHQRISRR